MIRISSETQLRGQIVLPASKSISNRALVINALSGNMAVPDNLSNSDDTCVMIRALRETWSAGGGCRVLDIGAAGTAMRFLTAYLCVTPGEYVLTGTERMQHRPIGILVDALRQLGASIAYEGEEGFPPLRTRGRAGLEGGDLTIRGDVSSQYISALLMIAPTFRRGLRLTLTGRIQSRPYLDMTVQMMREFGARVEWSETTDSGLGITVLPGPYGCRAYTIEGDWSAASYWYEMVALTRDDAPRIILPGLFRKSLQGDSAIRDMFRPLGVETTFISRDDGTEAVLLSRGGMPQAHLELDFTCQPDLAQTFVVCCAMLGTTFRFSGVCSLKIKETDRMAALGAELRKLGIVVHEDGDDVIYWDGQTLPNSLSSEKGMEEPFDTYEDHRMAMSLAPVCLRTGGQIQINNPEVVSKSYPAFWDDLKKVGFSIIEEVNHRRS